MDSEPGFAHADPENLIFFLKNWATATMIMCINESVRVKHFFVYTNLNTYKGASFARNWKSSAYHP